MPRYLLSTITILMGKAEAMHCGQFLNVHLKAAIAGNTEHAGIGLGQLHANRGGQSEIPSLPSHRK